MKRPSLTLDKTAVLDWLLRHGDKIVLAVVTLASLRFAWAGVEAFRSGGTRDDERPAAITRLATEAEQHIGREKRLPAGEVPARRPLAATVDPWRKPAFASDAPGRGLSQQMFPEFGKRTQPQVLPIEDLQAVAGIAVVATKPAAGKPRKPDEQPAGVVGKLTPYVIVTGLVPVARQEAEYRSRFSAVGFQDKDRDTPVWVAYKIERAEVGPQGPGDWKTVLTGAAGFDPAKNREWEPLPADERTAGLSLGPTERTPAFCGPLPRLAEGAWGREAVHPSLADRAADPPNQRMLRYFDDDVQPTVTYTYRVTHALANPNYNDPKKPESAIPSQDLEDPEVVKSPFLVSPMSMASRPVTVPVPTRILADVLRRDQRPEIKEWKPGWLEIMILGPGGSGRARALRSLVIEPGGAANVDQKWSESKHPKPAMRRSKGENIVTDQLLVDARGSQTEDKGIIQEPFELLFRRPDGGFEWVTAADSESLIERHRDTLQAAEEPKPEQPTDKPPDKNNDPFATPTGKKK
jgi:hypothetical protein